MLAAFAVSALFLISYVAYHLGASPVHFQKTGALRTIYFAILSTHTLLAALVPPLAAVTLWRGLSGRFDKHRCLARRTSPVWLYVSATGVLVYWMLCRM